MGGPWLSLWGALLLLGSTDGYLNGRIDSCEFNSSLPENIRFLSSYFYNKLMYLRFDSDLGWFVGYTAFGVKAAERLNDDETLVSAMRAMKDEYCGHNIKLLYGSVLSKSVEPHAVLTTAPSAGGHIILVCSVYGFFPKDITVTWTNHTQEIIDGVTSTDLQPDSDWYYQLHSHLDYSPRSGDQISCVINHSSLKNPMILHYGGGLSEVDLELVLVGAFGLVLGLVLSLTGFLCYMCQEWKQKRELLS